MARVKINLENSNYKNSICKICGKPLSFHSNEYIRFIITDYNKIMTK
jgi:RNase P subunit RPR2